MQFAHNNVTNKHGLGRVLTLVLEKAGLGIETVDHVPHTSASRSPFRNSCSHLAVVEANQDLKEGIEGL